ncbi:hypothetical protein I7I53_07589 [Histoplasma capsulatum var. duboisii H88]|uniref:Uncharacterized protein n=1 Tax=Ajellomyces capsulatus (strain H88) TaxID=544711 RepID=A0A8A1LHZ0_AJEC8|nr:hypothetical protein I7I53_07589 [Histoplasma capsulatum var. duboisii H88]
MARLDRPKTQERTKGLQLMAHSSSRTDKQIVGKGKTSLRMILSYVRLFAPMSNKIFEHAGIFPRSKSHAV